MKRVGFLTAECMLEGSPNLRDDHHEHLLEFIPMKRACAERMISLETLVWDSAFNPADYDGFVVGTVWDYPQKVDAFLSRIGELPRLMNSQKVIQWNLKKSYVHDLQKAGVSIVPTLFVDAITPGTIAEAFAQFDRAPIVAKPLVGACAWRQVRLNHDEPMPPPDQCPPGKALIQPFLNAATNEGELSLLYFGGEYSHAVMKKAAPGDYRVQSVFGGTETTHHASGEERKVAENALRACSEILGEELLYARVDLMRNDQGAWCLMELELIEPYLYPEQGPGFENRFADALLRRL